MELKRYTQLPIPADSAWERKSFWKKLPSWLKNCIEGIRNWFTWFPILYKDKNWDTHHIFEVLKFKLIQQRKYLVEANRHMGVERLNRDITLCLNLIERIQVDYYSMEYMDYHESLYNRVPTERPDYSELKIERISDNFDTYFKKYRTTVREVIKGKPELTKKKDLLAMTVAHKNQEKCQRLLFKVLNEKIGHWWD